MEKKLTYKEYMRIQNLLSKIKGMDHIDNVKDEVHSTIKEIKEILDINKND